MLTGCPKYGDIRLTNIVYETSIIGSGENYTEGYLEFCTSPESSQWVAVCGGEYWTDNEAKVACNQLGYSNATTIGKQAVKIQLN